jgi:hypothetical protein
MADKKISALTAASTPLAGTEVLPIVQSGSTVKVAVSDLTAGRAVSMGSGGVIGNGSAYSNLTLNSSSAGGFDLNIQTAGVGRWVVAKTATVDDFFIYRYSDAGSYAGNPLQISRSNGNVRLENNLVIGTSGNGIDFSATPGTGTSELLADYEEGTWTPTIASQTGALTSYTSIGYYTKVGRTITVFGSFVITDAGTASGTANISNLPFTSLNLPAGPDVIGTGVVREYNSTGLTYFVNIADNATTGTIVTSTNGGIVWINNYAYLWSVTYQTA